MTVDSLPPTLATTASLHASARRPPWWRELCLGAVTLGVYALVEGAGGARRAEAAQRHGAWLLDLERSLRIEFERPMNVWLAQHQMLRVAADYEYAITYVVSAFWLLAWLYVRRPEMYRWARNSFLLLNAFGMACFALCPVTPPRLLPGAGFVDTVRAGHTWGSWGSPLVSHANQLAAMPSLHVAWALWVSVVLACVSGARWVQGLSAAHVLVTIAVILATANHYLLDAAGAVVVIWLTLACMSLFQDRPTRDGRSRVPAADAFFLHAESAAWPQHVGGAVIIACDGDVYDYRDRLRAQIEKTLPRLPRFTQRLWWPSRWRRPRWTAAGALDWDWHVPVRDLSGPGGAPGGMAAVRRHIAESQATPLPRDRPLWRILVLTGFAPGKVGAVLLVHHAIADGIGTVAQAVRLFDQEPPPIDTPARQPGWLARAAGVAVGLAQLAADGRARGELPASDPAAGAERVFGTLSIPLSRLRAIAGRHQVRVTDVMISAVAAATRQALGPRPAPRRFRVATPLMVRAPDAAAEGNVTAAVIADVPLDEADEGRRLARVAAASRRLRTGSRALASRFVLTTGVAVLPPPAQAWFARTVYGRRFFQAIVSNMPGPTGRYRVAGAPIVEVYPILPLASRAPLGVGALSWDGIVHFGISATPALVRDADEFGEAVCAAIAAMEAAAPARAASDAEPDVTPAAEPKTLPATEPTR